METKIEGSTPPSDAQWIGVSPNDVEVQKSGEWALNEINRVYHSDLKLNVIHASWVMKLASGYGNLYLIHLNARNGGLAFNYEAIVWVKPAESELNLVSFKKVDTNSSHPDL